MYKLHLPQKARPALLSFPLTATAIFPVSLTSVKDAMAWGKSQATRGWGETETRLEVNKGLPGKLKLYKKAQHDKK